MPRKGKRAPVKWASKPASKVPPKESVETVTAKDVSMPGEDGICGYCGKWMLPVDQKKLAFARCDTAWGEGHTVAVHAECFLYGGGTGRREERRECLVDNCTRMASFCDATGPVVFPDVVHYAYNKANPKRAIQPASKASSETSRKAKGAATNQAKSSLDDSDVMAAVGCQFLKASGLRCGRAIVDDSLHACSMHVEAARRRQEISAKVMEASAETKSSAAASGEQASDRDESKRSAPTKTSRSDSLLRAINPTPAERAKHARESAARTKADQINAAARAKVEQQHAASAAAEVKMTAAQRAKDLQKARNAAAKKEARAKRANRDGTSPSQSPPSSSPQQMRTSWASTVKSAAVSEAADPLPLSFSTGREGLPPPRPRQPAQLLRNPDGSAAVREAASIADDAAARGLGPQPEARAAPAGSGVWASGTSAAAIVSATLPPPNASRPRAATGSSAHSGRGGDRRRHGSAHQRHRATREQDGGWDSPTSDDDFQFEGLPDDDRVSAATPDHGFAEDVDAAPHSAAAGHPEPVSVMRGVFSEADMLGTVDQTSSSLPSSTLPTHVSGHEAGPAVVEDHHVHPPGRLDVVEQRVLLPDLGMGWGDPVMEQAPALQQPEPEPDWDAPVNSAAAGPPPGFGAASMAQEQSLHAHSNSGMFSMFPADGHVAQGWVSHADTAPVSASGVATMPSASVSAAPAMPHSAPMAHVPQEVEPTAAVGAPLIDPSYRETLAAVDALISGHVKSAIKAVRHAEGVVVDAGVDTNDAPWEEQRRTIDAILQEKVKQVEEATQVFMRVSSEQEKINDQQGTVTKQLSAEKQLLASREARVKEREEAVEARENNHKKLMQVELAKLKAEKKHLQEISDKQRQRKELLQEMLAEAKASIAESQRMDSEISERRDRLERDEVRVLKFGKAIGAAMRDFTVASNPRMPAVAAGDSSSGDAAAVAAAKS